MKLMELFLCTSPFQAPRRKGSHYCGGLCMHTHATHPHTAQNKTKHLKCPKVLEPIYEKSPTEISQILTIILKIA